MRDPIIEAQYRACAPFRDGHIHIVDLGLCLCMQPCLEFPCMLHARLTRRAMHFCMQTQAFLCMLHARLRRGLILFGMQAQGCSWCSNSLTVHSTTMSLLHKIRPSCCRFTSVVVHLGPSRIPPRLPLSSTNVLFLLIRQLCRRRCLTRICRQESHWDFRREVHHDIVLRLRHHRLLSQLGIRAGQPSCV